MFEELLNNPNGVEPGPLQKGARQRFPSVVCQSHLEPHVAGSGVPERGRYTIIGVASYSPLELQLLDDVEAAYPQWGDAAKVAVFDLMECRDANELRKFLPVISVVKQTPVVAIWDDAKLVNVQIGLRMAREALKCAGFLR